MNRLGILTIGFVFSTIFLQAQPRVLPVSLDSLHRGQLLTTYPWQYHAGDDLRWASPHFDDRNWLPYKPYFDRDNAPPGWKGIGWFRLHIELDSVPAQQELTILVAQIGATEVYIDGKRVGGFGTIGHSATSGSDYASHNELITFRLQQPGHHLIAIRQATFRSYITRGMRYQQGFRSWLARDVGALNNNRAMSVGLQGVFVLVFVALLHLFLFLFYPARQSNLYYSLWQIAFGATSTCVYFEYFATDPIALQSLAYGFWFGNVAFSIVGIVFIYSVCYTTFPRLIWGWYGLALLMAGLTAFHSVINSTPWRSGFVLLCLLEVFRVVILATLRGQSGIWLIGLGLLSIAFGIFVGTSDVLHIWQNNGWGQMLFTNFCFLTLPLCTSLYLARDFGDRLKQVEALSAQTRAQEAEKLKLIAEQNEQLERTVRERTDQLQRQTDKLQELDAFKSRFFINLTHEFRTPLTLILGPTEQLLARHADDKTQQQVGLIRRNAQRLLRLINQLLDLSKLEAGKMSLTTAPGDLISLVRGTLQSFESLARQNDIALQFTAVQERLVKYVDRDKLEKILYNLLANALKFTPTGGTVSVSLTDDNSVPEGWIQLSIQDTGVGIPAAKQPYIFDRFYQADASDTREQEGTGIGLALTKELVDLQGGTINLRSQEGIGTLVVVQLPLQTASAAGEAAEQPISPDQPLNPVIDEVAELETAPLVLLIEDNDDVRAFIRSSLSGSAEVAPYRIIEAPNGEVGVRLAQQHVPDLVITDLMMPRMDGYQVCTALKQDERTSHIPVIMLTARADLESKLEGLQTGADVYLAKPFSQRELVAHLTNLIALRRQLQQRYSGTTPSQPMGWSTNLPSLPSMEQLFLNRVRAAVEDHLDDEQYSVERLCEEVGLSRTQLHRKLKALTNESPGELIRLLRLQRAHELLSANVGTVAEVAYQVGFGNPANFSTSFSRQFGYAPSEVRRKTVS